MTHETIRLVHSTLFQTLLRRFGGWSRGWRALREYVGHSSSCAELRTSKLILIVNHLQARPRVQILQESVLHSTKSRYSRRRTRGRRERVSMVSHLWSQTKLPSAQVPHEETLGTG